MCGMVYFSGFGESQGWRGLSLSRTDEERVQAPASSFSRTHSFSRTRSFSSTRSFSRAGSRNNSPPCGQWVSLFWPSRGGGGFNLRPHQDNVPEYSTVPLCTAVHMCIA